jgi:hypothetical protein
MNEKISPVQPTPLQIREPHKHTDEQEDCRELLINGPIN